MNLKKESIRAISLLEIASAMPTGTRVPSGSKEVGPAFLEPALDWSAEGRTIEPVKDLPRPLHLGKPLCRASVVRLIVFLLGSVVALIAPRLGFCL